MFRIQKIFENDLTIIWKIEGKIFSNEKSQFWIDEINRLVAHVRKQIIFDMCAVTFMGSTAAQMFVGLNTKNVYLLNCPTFVKNMLQSAGSSLHVLDV